MAIQDLVAPKTEVKVEKPTTAVASSTTAASTVTRPGTSATRTLPANVQIKQEKGPPEKRMKFVT